MNKKISIDIPKNLRASIVCRVQTAFRLKPKSMCIVTGCPRSGTSAMISWLDKNDEVARFFESRVLVSAHQFLSEIERFKNLNCYKKYFLREIKKTVLKYYSNQKLIWNKYLIDKEPLEPIAFPGENYFAFLSGVRKIFPEIKIVFMVRNPVNTIWSMRNRKWGYSLTSQRTRDFSLNECIKIWSDCADLALQLNEVENVYICRFERLLEDPITISNQILRFIGLENSRPFEVKATKRAGFGESDKNLIHDKTITYLEKINQL